MNRQASLLLLAVTTLLAPLCGAQTEVFKEDFSSYSKVPTLLNGKTPAGARAAWNSSPNLTVESDNGNRYASVNAVRNIISAVPINPQWLQGTITLKADLRPQSSNADAPTWLAIGIGNSQPDSNNIRWPQGILFLINTNGGYELHLSADKLIRVRSGRISNFDPANATTLSLSYNHSNQTISASADGKSILEDYELVNNDFTANPAFAGFSGFGQKNQAALVENFSITVTP